MTLAYKEDLKGSLLSRGTYEKFLTKICSGLWTNWHNATYSEFVF